jgi:toxin ParE1/3/4
MVQIIWSKKAILRLNEITAYLEDLDGSEEIGIRFKKAIYDASRRLNKLPESGRIVPEFNAPNIREIFYKKYRIIYELKLTVVEILIVEHSSRILKL